MIRNFSVTRPIPLLLYNFCMKIRNAFTVSLSQMFTNNTALCTSEIHVNFEHANTNSRTLLILVPKKIIVSCYHICVAGKIIYAHKVVATVTKFKATNII